MIRETSSTYLYNRLLQLQQRRSGPHQVLMMRLELKIFHSNLSLLLTLRYPVIIQQILRDLGEHRGGGGLGVLGGTRTLDLDDHDEFRIGCGRETSVGCDGVSSTTRLISSLGRDLRRTGLTCDIISFDRTLLRETDGRTLGEHGDDLLGGVFLDDATQWSGCILDDRAVGESE